MTGSTTSAVKTDFSHASGPSGADPKTAFMKGR
jgi:hypothetical protein